jgi:hypothetical protein
MDLVERILAFAEDMSEEHRGGRETQDSLSG